MRFFIDGYEIDINDPLFHMPNKNVDEMIFSLNYIKEMYEYKSNGSSKLSSMLQQ